MYVSIYIFIYIYCIDYPVCLLSWRLSPPHEILFQSKQGSCGFQAQVTNMCTYRYLPHTHTHTHCKWDSLTWFLVGGSTVCSSNSTNLFQSGSVWLPKPGTCWVSQPPPPPPPPRRHRHRHHHHHHHHHQHHVHHVHQRCCFQAPIFLVCSFSKTVAFPKGHRPSRQGADSGGAKLRLCGAKKTSPRCQFVSVFYITPPPTGKLTYDMASLNFTIDTSLNRCILPLSCKGRSNYYPGFFGVVVPKCFLYTEYLHRFPMISLWMWPFFTPCGPIFPALIWTLFSAIFGAGFPLHKPYPYTLYRWVKRLVIIMTPGMNMNPKGWYRMPVLHLWHFIQASGILGVVIDPLIMLTSRWKRQEKCHCYCGEP